MRANSNVPPITIAVLILSMSLLLGLFITSEYVIHRGIAFLEGEQLIRHQAVLEGHARDPWQYRVFATYFVEVVLKVLERFQVPNHIAVSFVLVRVVQDTVILLLSFVYYRKLGRSLLFSLLGILVLAWGMSYSDHDSDLQFNTFFDIIFYLLAVLSILTRRFYWLIPITILASFNRETSGLIPFLLFGSIFLMPRILWRKLLIICFIVIVAYVGIFISLRLIYGRQELILPFGHQLGLDLLQYNIFRARTWLQLLATLNFIPLIAIIGFKKWPLQLRVFFWVIVPVWFLIHAFGSVMAETRLFLVPQTIVFIPGMLFSLTEVTCIPKRDPDQIQN